MKTYTLHILLLFLTAHLNFFSETKDEACPKNIKSIQ